MRSHFAGVKQKQGAGFAVLAEASSSPTLARLRQRLLKEWPQAQWAEYEPLTDDNVREGARLALGERVSHAARSEGRPASFCLPGCRSAWVAIPPRLRYARDFAAGREVVDGTMNRLYAVESGFSITGSAADHRLPLRSGQIAAFARATGAGGGAACSGDAGIESGWRIAGRTSSSRPWLPIWWHIKGPSVVAVGPQQPAEVHAGGSSSQCAAGQRWQDGSLHARPSGRRRRGTSSRSPQLAKAMHDGQVDTLLILGGNPSTTLRPISISLAAWKKVADDGSTWGSITTRQPSCASGMCRRHISSSRGAMRGRSTAPTASCSR